MKHDKGIWDVLVVQHKRVETNLHCVLNSKLCRSKMHTMQSQLSTLLEPYTVLQVRMFKHHEHLHPCTPALLP